jgi:hypothetical protein
MQKANSNMRGRHSETLTDSDLVDAYHAMTTKTGTSRVRQIVGDAAMIFGGAILLTGGLCSAAGVALVFVGLYVREYGGS